MLDAESLDIVEFAEATETEVGMYIPDDDLTDIRNVGDLKSTL